MKERILHTNATILSGSRHPEFAASVAAHLDAPLGEIKLTRFANSEIKVEVPAVRDNYVFVIQSHGAPVDEALMEQAAIINAAQRASARDITAVVPYRGYGRADKPDNQHESYMGPLTMRILESAGANRMIEVDPHAGQSAGFFEKPSTEYTPIPSYPAIIRYLEPIMNEPGSDVVIVSPDSGRAKLNRHYAEHFDRLRAIVDKMRTGTNHVEVMDIIGKVAGTHCVMIDDMIDTAGTIIEGATALRKLGAETITIVATHGIFSEPAVERLWRARESQIIDKVAVTDTLALPSDMPEDLVDIISVAPLVGDAIHDIYHGKSVSSRYSQLA
ncbi:ribose-phosphate pyrophosphokinase [Candidatus Saccharibacteria bacterium]|nr:ribose-phosphate pyrophosphokinase [Candidatus Saccharibacteria bacterium]